MGFDDFFDHDRRYKGHDYRHHYEYDDHPSTHSHHHQYDLRYQLLSRLRNSPKLRFVILIAGIFLITIIIIAAVLLVPLITKLSGFISQNGIQGLVEAVWKGIE